MNRNEAKRAVMGRGANRNLRDDTGGGGQPYTAPARGLREAGHDSRAVAQRDLARLFHSVGVPVAGIAFGGMASGEAEATTGLIFNLNAGQNGGSARSMAAPSPPAGKRAESRTRRSRSSVPR